MEKEIINIILSKLYYTEISKLYKEHSTKYEFPINLNVDNIPFNIVYDFNTEYFEQYCTILLENAFLYGIKNKKNKFIQHFLNNLDNLKNELESETMFKIKVSEYGIKNIFNNHYKNTKDDKLRIKYNKTITKIKNYNINITSITNIYRNLIIEFIENHNNDERIIDYIIYTKKYDYELLENNNYINKENISNFKIMLIRLILTDAFLYLENKKITDDDDLDIEIITDLESENEYESEEYDEYNSDKEKENEINMNILNHIYLCIKNNNFTLPKDLETRYNLYAIFNAYNSDDLNYKKLYFDNISGDKNKVLLLKKINPCYNLDFINNDTE